MTTASGRLLVIDDLESNRNLLSRALTQQGYEVVLAADGHQGLRMLDEQPVDLVLLDISMAGLTGFDVLTTIRRTRSAGQLPVIMVTGLSDRETVVEAFSLGANDYVTKPFDGAVVLARVRTQLSLRRAEAALRESEERYALAVRGANDGLWDWKLDSNVMYYSPRWKSMLGCAEADVEPSPEAWYRRVHVDDLERVKHTLTQHLEGTTPHFECEHRMLHADGTYRWVRSRGLVVRDYAGAAVRMAGSQSDITESKIADPLTGLPNRMLLLDRLERSIDRCQRHPEYTFAVLFVDLDRFKVVNDSLGRAAGDQLLTECAKRLERYLRTGDSVARLQGGGHTLAHLGGDEFTILLDDIRKVDDAIRVADRIQSALRAPFSVVDQEVVVSASIGIAVSQSGYVRAEDILRDADMAMNSAREQGKARYEVFDEAMRTRAASRLRLEADLRQGLERQELRLHYQPIVSLPTGRIAGFESLVRWQRGDTLLFPNEFLGIADEVGLALPITRLVLREACQAARHWADLLPDGPPLMLSVNIPPLALLERDLIEHVRDSLSQARLPPGCLLLEITETALLADTAAINEALRQLAGLGVRLALDDFGTGYSSLSYLHRFPISVLKIDRSFVSPIDDRADNPAIVRSIVTLAQSLNMETIAEGIETPAQLAALKVLGCEYGQGFLFSKAVALEAATELLTTQRAIETLERAR